MSPRLSYLYFIPHLLRTLLKRPVTVAFPYGPLQLPNAYRGQIVVDLDSCRGCGLCAKDCPAEALEVERLEGQNPQTAPVWRIVHYFDRCVGCGQCKLDCRYDAIHLQPSFKTGAPSRSALQIEWIKGSSKG